MIHITAISSLPPEQTWRLYTGPEHIVAWNFASNDWHCPKAAVDLRVGGKIQAIMAAKDGSISFDFVGEYTEINPNKALMYKLEDGRRVEVQFTSADGATKIDLRFDPESENSLELQQAGWQAILDNFVQYCKESQNKR